MALQFEARKVALKQDRTGFVLTLAIHPDDLPRFRRLAVAANAQPLWACNEDAVVELTAPFIGPKRTWWMYPFGSLLRHGATTATGSD